MVRGLTTAWQDLSERYENKRMFVKGLVGNNSGSAINDLQREINNCIPPLQMHKDMEKILTSSLQTLNTVYDIRISISIATNTQYFKRTVSSIKNVMLFM